MNATVIFRYNVRFRPPSSALPRIRRDFAVVKVPKRTVKDKALDCVARNHHTSAQKDTRTAVINFKKVGP
jgi:hypothetical protein